ncbi:MAG: 4Fe-4S dicluster domain-containing protein [Candidatus Tritonobacter lacicola]|nr:4Fe-4S dicluster domain-containing protein [Candidatus Tritonobacter lacicola]
MNKERKVAKKKGKEKEEKVKQEKASPKPEESKKEAAPQQEPKGEFIPIYFMGKKYMVPATVTIMKAIEYAGYRFIRGCGCRGGICGACGTVYRLPGSYKINVGLACQTVIEPDMYLTQIPFFPANKARYDIDEEKADISTILDKYPEIARCVSCNTCTKACPQDLEVMDYVQAALQGNIERAAKLSFECIMCGLCASRCPAEIVQYNIGILCRRLYSKHMMKKAQHLSDRLKEIDEGKFDGDMEKMKKMGTEELEKAYAERDIEPV